MYIDKIVVWAACLPVVTANITGCSLFRNRIWDDFGIFGLLFSQYDNVYFLTATSNERTNGKMIASNQLQFLFAFGSLCVHFIISNFQRFAILNIYKANISQSNKTRIEHGVQASMPRNDELKRIA